MGRSTARYQRPQSEAESLIPMFEHMVDQALSKTPNTHA